ncbi:MAG: sulfite exporter TauE/SafE family protein, partial [Acidimicrobiales bacterium]
GLVAGAVNTVVGSGSLLTFPVLLSLGFSPLVANVSNTVGLVPGAASGAVGYRRELAGQRSRAARLGTWAAAGGLGGSVLLLVYPTSFQVVVPYLVLVAVALVVAQPWLGRHLPAGGGPAGTGGWWLRLGIGLTGVYGGYFGAAQGVLLIGLLALGLSDDLQRLNGLKNVLALAINGVAAALFLVAAPVAWLPALTIAGSSVVGGQVGAQLGRRIPDPLLRAVIVAAGTGVAVKLLAFG